MNEHSTINKDASAPTSKAGPPHSPKTEKEFLAYQATVAQKALGVSARAAVNGLGKILDPRTWTRRFPLPSTGLAAVAGFVAVTHQGKPETSLPPEPQSDGEPVHQSSSQWLTILIQAGVDILKNSITPVLTEELAEKLHGNREKES